MLLTAWWTSPRNSYQLRDHRPRTSPRGFDPWGILLYIRAVKRWFLAHRVWRIRLNPGVLLAVLFFVLAVWLLWSFVPIMFESDIDPPHPPWQYGESAIKH